MQIGQSDHSPQPGDIPALNVNGSGGVFLGGKGKASAEDCAHAASFGYIVPPFEEVPGRSYIGEKWEETAGEIIRGFLKRYSPRGVWVRSNSSRDGTGLEHGGIYESVLTENPTEDTILSALHKVDLSRHSSKGLVYRDNYGDEVLHYMLMVDIPVEYNSIIFSSDPATKSYISFDVKERSGNGYAICKFQPGRNKPDWYPYGIDRKRIENAPWVPRLLSTITGLRNIHGPCRLEVGMTGEDVYLFDRHKLNFEPASGRPVMPINMEREPLAVTPIAWGEGSFQLPVLRIPDIDILLNSVVINTYASGVPGYFARTDAMREIYSMLREADKWFPEGYVMMLSRTCPASAAFCTQGAAMEAGSLAWSLNDILFALIFYESHLPNMRAVLTTDEHEYLAHDFGRLLKRGIDVVGVFGEQTEAVRSTVHTGDTLSAVFDKGVASIYHSPAAEPHPLLSAYKLLEYADCFEVSLAEEGKSAAQ